MDPRMRARMEAQMRAQAAQNAHARMQAAMDASRRQANAHRQDFAERLREAAEQAATGQQARGQVSIQRGEPSVSKLLTVNEVKVTDLYEGKDFVIIRES